MKKATWIDSTSYRQNEVCGETEPRNWQMQLGPATLEVHRFFYSPDRWFATCLWLEMDRVELGTRDIDIAKRKALDIAKKRAANMVKRAHAIISVLNKVPQ